MPRDVSAAAAAAAAAQKKKGIKSSLGRFFSKKEKVRYNSLNNTKVWLLIIVRNAARLTFYYKWKLSAKAQVWTFTAH